MNAPALTAEEQTFVEEALSTGVVDLRSRPKSIIRSTILRAVVRGDVRIDGQACQSLVVMGGCVDGPIDLSITRSDFSLALIGVELEAVSLCFSRFAVVRLVQCLIGRFGQEASPIDARAAEIDNEFRIDRCKVSCVSRRAAIDLVGARVGGELVLDGSRVTNFAGPTIRADRLKVGGNARFAEGFVSRAIDPDGGVVLADAAIGGQLNFAGADLANKMGPALAAMGAHVESDLVLTAGFQARSSTFDQISGTLNLTKASIGGELLLMRAHIANDLGPALSAQSLTLRGNALCRELKLDGSGPDAAADLSHSHLHRSLDLTDARLTSATGSALVGEGLTIDGKMQAGGIAATARAELGAVHLPFLRVGAQVDLAAATLANSDGPALFMASSQIGAALYLNAGFRGEGTGPRGVVQLSNATLGHFEVGDAQLANPTGPAIICDSARIAGSCQLLGPLTLSGSGPLGTLRMVHTRIGIQLAVGRSEDDTVTISCQDGPAIHADSIEARTLIIHGTLQGQPALLLDAGKVETLRLRAPNFGPNARFSLDGLTYRGRPGNGTAQLWSRTLTDASVHQTPQPYRQLANAFRDLGRQRDARSILIAEEDARRRLVAKPERRRSTGMKRARLGLRSALESLSRLMIGYGYKPGRAIWFLTASMLTAIVLVLCAPDRSGAHAAAILDRPPQHIDELRRSCHSIEKVGLAIRMTLPVVAEVDAGSCEINSATAWGAGLDAAGIALQALSWVAATLGVAGLTGLIRPDRAV